MEEAIFFRNALSATMDMVRIRVCYSLTDPREIIARYTAAVADNFVGWIGMTIPWVRHEAARCALVDNLRCETSEDHTSMLLNFARGCNALPETKDYRRMEQGLANIRAIFRDPVYAGLCGLALVTTLEYTSQFFIPDLKVRALACECADFTYTDCHGEADAKHASDLIRAVEAEMCMGYQDLNKVVDGMRAAGELICFIYE